MRKCNITTKMFLLFTIILFSSCKNKMSSYKVSVLTPQEMRDYFSIDSNKIRISGHRGGMRKGIPENSIAAMELTLQTTPAFFEIDPRLTKDSVIVLMHDETLERTTTGVGLVSDYTYDELQQFRLKDRWGEVTAYKIPTLKEVIEWARGKTILNLDRKTVPLEMTVNLLKQLNACHVMVTVHSAEQALYYYKHNPEIMFSAFIRTMDEFEAYEKSGIPWDHFIAYVGREMNPERFELYRLLRERGVCCMISLAPTADKIEDMSKRTEAYREAIGMKSDIIETDFPHELVDVLENR